MQPRKPEIEWPRLDPATDFLDTFVMRNYGEHHPAEEAERSAARNLPMLFAAIADLFAVLAVLVFVIGIVLLAAFAAYEKLSPQLPLAWRRVVVFSHEYQFATGIVLGVLVICAFTLIGVSINACVLAMRERAQKGSPR